MTTSSSPKQFQPLISHTTIHSAMDLAELLRRDLIRTIDKFPPCPNKDKLTQSLEHTIKIADNLAAIHSTL